MNHQRRSNQNVIKSQTQSRKTELRVQAVQISRSGSCSREFGSKKSWVYFNPHAQSDFSGNCVTKLSPAHFPKILCRGISKVISIDIFKTSYKRTKSEHTRGGINHPALPINSFQLSFARPLLFEILQNKIVYSLSSHNILLYLGVLHFEAG